MSIYLLNFMFSEFLLHASVNYKNRLSGLSVSTLIDPLSYLNVPAAYLWTGEPLSVLTCKGSRIFQCLEQVVWKSVIPTSWHTATCSCDCNAQQLAYWTKMNTGKPVRAHSLFKNKKNKLLWACFSLLSIIKTSQTDFLFFNASVTALPLSLTQTNFSHSVPWWKKIMVLNSNQSWISFR